jgi:hypothetical protein
LRFYHGGILASRVLRLHLDGAAEAVRSCDLNDVLSRIRSLKQKDVAGLFSIEVAPVNVEQSAKPTGA